MAGTEKQKTKLLYILKILWEETDEMHRLSAAQIAEKVTVYGIHCERKSVYKSLAELEEFGFDIIRTRQGAYLASRMFELPELKLLVDAVQSSKFITEKKSNELIEKLGNLLSRYDSGYLRRQVFINNRVKTMNESIYYNVDAIYEGIRQNRQITFYYWNWNVKKEMAYKHNGEKYRISPWFLQWENEKYYLVGHDEKSGKIKHFRVDKMEQIEVLGRSREGDAIFRGMDMASYRTHTFGMFQGQPELVTLRMKNNLAGVAVDRFGTDVWMHPLDEQYFTMVVDVMVSNQFFGWVVGLGEGVEIVGPAWVREKYKTLLDKLAQNL